MTEVEQLEQRLTEALTELTRLQAAVTSARQRSEAATPGGLTGYDPAILSGTRRRPNRRADAARFNAYDREAAAAVALKQQEERVDGLRRAVTRAKRTAPVPFTPEALAAATHVRDEHGWHEVVRVNAKSVTVRTAWSWTDRISTDRLRQVATLDRKHQPEPQTSTTP